MLFNELFPNHIIIKKIIAVYLAEDLGSAILLDSIPLAETLDEFKSLKVDKVVVLLMVEYYD